MIDKLHEDFPTNTLNLFFKRTFSIIKHRSRRNQNKGLEVMLKQKILAVCLFILTCIVSYQVYGDSNTNTKLTLLPGAEIKQGNILLVRLETSESGSYHVQWDGKSDKLFQQSPGIYEGIVGISVDSKPGVHKLTVLNDAGQLMANEEIVVQDAHFLRQNITVSKSTNALKPLPGELEAVEALKETITPVRYWTQSLISPTAGCENSPFGVKRYHNGVYIHDYHKGVDLHAAFGQPIRAVTDGVVVIAAPHFRLHGGTVGLDHGQGLTSIYIHMSKVAVHTGEHVKKGDIIGYVGATGFATGPHLHWGLYANGVPVNPDYWISVPHC
jgi:Peptidase family M23